MGRIVVSIIVCLLAIGQPARLLGKDLNKLLIKSIKNKNVSSVRDLLGQGADPNAINSVGTTMLMLAVEEESLVMTSALLKAGADPSAIDISGKSAPDIVNAKGLSDIGSLLTFYTQNPVARDVPCNYSKMRPDKEKGEHVMFFPLPRERIEHLVTDAALAGGFEMKKEKKGIFIAHRRYPYFTGKKGGGEKLLLRFEPVEQREGAGTPPGTNVYARTKKTMGGVVHQRRWAKSILEYTQCLHTLLDQPDYVSGPYEMTQDHGRIKDGTPVKMRLMRSLFSKTSSEGQAMSFIVSDDVVVEGSNLIPKGAKASGKSYFQQTRQNGVKARER